MMKLVAIARWGVISLISSLLLTGPVLASGAAETDPAIDSIRSSIARELSDLRPDSIQPSAIPGLYEVMFGARLVYMSADGNYLMTGEMSDIRSGENLTEPKLRAAKLKAANEVGPEEMVIFAAAEPKHTIKVFTDIDCGYCRKLHAEMDAYNEAGISVEYLFYPRAGIGSEAYNKAVTVWCSDDRKLAMTEAKQGKTLPAKKCANPVKEHFDLGQALSLRGTPALMLDDGEMIPGYVPANRLKTLLDERTRGN